HLALSPDGRTLLSGSEDRSGMGDTAVRLYEVATGQMRRRFLGHRGFVLSVAFAPDNRGVVSASDDGTVVLWATAERPGRGGGAAPDRARLDALWEALGSRSAPEAHRAMCELAAAPKESVAFLAGRLRPVPALGEGRLARLLADLEGKSFTAREAATRELTRLGEAVEGALRKAAESPRSLGGKRRLAQPLGTPGAPARPAPPPPRPP